MRGTSFSVSLFGNFKYFSEQKVKEKVGTLLSFQQMFKPYGATGSDLLSRALYNFQG